MDPVPLIESLNEIGLRYGTGRNFHVGDTIMGVKGRIGFEAPAPIILVTAHRELEKIILTKWQAYQKDYLSNFYGMLLHEAQHFDPVMRDIEAFLESSQKVVTGDVYVRLSRGSISVEGCGKPLLHVQYRDGNVWGGKCILGWTGCSWASAKIAGMQSLLANKARSIQTFEGE